MEIHSTVLELLRAYRRIEGRSDFNSRFANAGMRLETFGLRISFCIQKDRFETKT
jgi:hypothetical protein